MMRGWALIKAKKNRLLDGRVTKKGNGLFYDSAGHELLQ
jgi:hypothetical protein